MLDDDREAARAHFRAALAIDHDPWADIQAIHDQARTLLEAIGDCAPTDGAAPPQ